jgi:hypothetical protein
VTEAVLRRITRPLLVISAQQKAAHTSQGGSRPD